MSEYYKVDLKRIKENFIFPLNKVLKEMTLMKAPLENYGSIIVKETVLGYYEIITKTKIPAIKKYKYSNESNIPDSGYRIDTRIKSKATKEEVKEYINKNNNLDFINELNEFISIADERYNKALEVYNPKKELVKKKK